MCRRVAARPKGATSTGSGKAPRRGTIFDLSAITAMRAEAAATIFSRSSAPPPPLISLRSGSISSAPSTVRSSSGMSSSVVMRDAEPLRLGERRLRGRDATHLEPAATLSPRRSTKWRAVEPVPRPRRMPGSTRSSARLAASRFRRSLSSIRAHVFPSVIWPCGPSGAGKIVRRPKQTKPAPVSEARRRFTGSGS